jgi:hypothetical protein
MDDTNYQLLVSAARLLKPLLDELVFIGGCATGLLITDEAAPLLFVAGRMVRLDSI